MALWSSLLHTLSEMDPVTIVRIVKTVLEVMNDAEIAEHLNELNELRLRLLGSQRGIYVNDPARYRELFLQELANYPYI